MLSRRRAAVIPAAPKRPYGDLSPWISPCAATVVAVSMSAQGLPVDVQVIGPFLEDFTTIHFAGLLAREFASTFRRPALS